MSGPLPIPLETALLNYCLYYGIYDRNLRESMAKMVQILDDEYLADAFKKLEEKAPKK